MNDNVDNVKINSWDLRDESGNLIKNIGSQAKYLNIFRVCRELCYGIKCSG